MSSFRDRFLIPTNQDVGASRVNGQSSSSLPVRPFERLLPLGEDPCIYLCGNSLGLLPQSAEALVHQELRVWGSRQAYLIALLIANFSPSRRAVQGHHDHPHGREWVNLTNHVNPLLAELLGTEILTACGCRRACAWPNILSWPKVRARLRSLAWAL